MKWHLGVVGGHELHIPQDFGPGQVNVRGHGELGAHGKPEDVITPGKFQQESYNIDRPARGPS